MKVTLRVDPETGVAIATGSGVAGADDARESVSELWALPSWPGRAVVWDLRMLVFDASPSDVRTIARFVLENQPSPPPARVAFVTDRDADFGMARMFQLFREDPYTSFQVFRDYDEALTWAVSPSAPAAPPGEGGGAG